MLVVLRGRALIDDELAYGMQAGFFARGHVAGPELGVNPSDVFTIPTRLGYSIKYLPGEPLLQIPGVFLGVPALMHLPVVLVTLWAWHETLRRSSGLEIARFGTICLACSPMLMFTSATGLSHASCLMWVALMGLGLELGKTDRPVLGPALSASVSRLGSSRARSRWCRSVPCSGSRSCFSCCVAVHSSVVRCWRSRPAPAFRSCFFTTGC